MSCITAQEKAILCGLKRASTFTLSQLPVTWGNLLPFSGLRTPVLRCTIIHTIKIKIILTGCGGTEAGMLWVQWATLFQKTKTKKKKKKGKVNLRTATGRSCRNDVRSYLSEEMTDNSMSTVALRIFQKDRMNREVCVCWGDRTQWYSWYYLWWAGSMCASVLVSLFFKQKRLKRKKLK